MTFMERMAATLDDEAFAAAFSPEGLAPQCTWEAEDGWLVSYTTARIRGGELAGLFACFLYKPRCFLYKPRGRGSRVGSPVAWERVRRDVCDTRREAKQRALAAYYEHSPTRAEKHGWNGSAYEAEAQA